MASTMQAAAVEAFGESQIDLLKREFAPYVGVSLTQTYAGTKRLARADGGETSLVSGRRRPNMVLKCSPFCTNIINPVTWSGISYVEATPAVRER